jgi:hypothetical protein
MNTALMHEQAQHTATDKIRIETTSGRGGGGGSTKSGRRVKNAMRLYTIRGKMKSVIYD